MIGPSRAVQLLRGALRRVRLVFQRDARISFSQEGEDLLIGRLFDSQSTGFYVDVGAHHPTRFSNTYLLYERGWSGINIDATPGSMSPFMTKRPRDVNLEMAVAEEAGTREIHLFEESAINTLLPEVVDRRASETGQTSLGVVSVLARPLRDILDQHLPAATKIDLLTIDVEGCDFEVIRSNDWQRYRPRVLVIELLEAELLDMSSREEISYLAERGYAVHSKLHNSVVLVDSAHN